MNKTILEINSCTIGSTGRIMRMVAETARNSGFTVYTSSPVQGNEEKIKSKNHIYIGNLIDKRIHLLLAKATGYHGCFSHIATAIFLMKVDKIKPNLIHIHNLHNCYINIPMLFAYIKKRNIPVVWTLHDCWSFTGHCPYYDFVQCDKWQVECHDCPQLARYPYAYVDNTRRMFNKKREMFTGANIVLVPPSKWLGEEIKKSFLNCYPIKVINNGIDLDIFKPINSDFRKQYNIENKIIILGVAGSWAQRKGLDVFVRLAEELPTKYQIVIVGVGEDEKAKLPQNIIAITRTSNQKELAKIYSSSDFYLNPTREENFPTTNLEALACGIGIITYNTGGSPEIVDKDTGIVVDKDDYNSLITIICSLERKPFNADKCRKRALQYEKEKKYKEYVELFEAILEGSCL